MIRFEPYQDRHYQQVCDFLIELQKESPYHENWNWARFEWMHEHPLTQKELLGEMGLWFDDDHLIGAVLFDMYFGEAFVGVLKPYHYLYPELLEYAYGRLKDDQGLGVSFHDGNKEEIEEALRQGFHKEEAEEFDCVKELSDELPVLLMEGYTAEAYDAQRHPKEIEWLFYQGFDNGNDKEEFLRQYKEPTGTRPHFDPYLCIVVKDKRGELVASASTWYDQRTDYAYLEPVCVVPSHRKLGLGKAAVYLALNHARDLGARRVYVNSGQEFYLRIGFRKKNHYSFYWKKE